MSEQDWNDIFVKEIGTSKEEKERGRGLFSKVLEDAFERCCQEIGPDSMDYCHLKNILNFIKTRQWEKIRPYVAKVNETQLRERVQGLTKRAEKERLKMNDVCWTTSLTRSPCWIPGSNGTIC